MPRGGYKRPCETLWGLIRPIGCRQREHVVLKKNGKARRGFHANENSFLRCMEITDIGKDDTPKSLVNLT